jgi:DTW domain-containing protein YfiP
MYLHKTAQRGLPVLSLPPPAVVPERMREQNREEGHSTLEAIAAALRFLEGEQAAKPLEEMLAAVVQRVFTFRGRKGA